MEPDSVRDFTYRNSILDDVSRIDNAVYRGVMSLLLSRNVHDFGSERKPAKSVPWEDIEDHHIFPKRFLGPYGLKGDIANNIANRTPLTRTTNSNIANAAPHVYLADRKTIGSLPIEPVLTDHLINPQLAMEPFATDGYKMFLKDRTEQIIHQIAKHVSADPLLELAADVPLFVEHCEAVAAEIDVKLRWLGEQARRGLSVWSGALPVRHVMLEVACEPSIVGSL